MSLRGPGPIPNRWLKCPRKSDSIIAERFLAFKTPLSQAFNAQMPIECWFTPEMLFGYIKTLKLKLGLWIDLTNTKRFYDRSVVDKNGAQYVKMQCRGHGETPSREQTQAFIEIVDDFIKERPFDIIAVHCTHGFNRTGFLIASYLVERLDCSVEGALAMFAESRPPGIYKQDYINELFIRYESEEDAIQAPVLPDWCYDEYDNHDNRSPQKRKHDDDETSTSQQAVTSREGTEYDEVDDDEQFEEEGEANDQNGDSIPDGEPRKKRRREKLLKNATFMAGVSGVVLVTDQPRLGELQLKVQKMCGWQTSGFPGCQPVSMDCNNLHRLQEIPYRVSWKADGTRYMMLINKRDEIYFFDRNFSCFQVESLTFLRRGNLNEHLENTLLDGEMVLDKHNGETTPRYLIYDIISFLNHEIRKHHFYPDRLTCIKKEIIEPRHDAVRKGIINRVLEPFGVRNKDFWEIGKSVSLLGEKFAKTLLHEPDGLIFQPSKQPYTAGVCPDVLKWKPSEMNSIDFRLKIVKEGGMGCLDKFVGHLYVVGYDMPIAQIQKITKSLRELDNKIVECTFTNEGKWEVMRERTDKTLPNSYKTALAVFKSIEKPVSKELLLNFIAKHGFPEDCDRMPPPQTNHIVHRQQNQQQQQ